MRRASCVHAAQGLGAPGSAAQVRAAGALPALVGYAGALLTWAAPQALYAAELASMFPENAGFVPGGAVGRRSTSTTLQGG